MLRSVVIFLLLGSLDAGDVVVDSEEHAAGFYSGFDDLGFDEVGFPDVDLAHVRDDSSVAVDAEEEAAFFAVFRAESGERADDVCAAVLGEGSGDGFEGVGHGAVGLLLEAQDGLRVLVEAAADLHLGGASSGDESRTGEDVAGDSEGVVDVALHLVERVFGAAAEQDGAGRRVLGFDEVGEVLVADLLDLEEAAVFADVGLLDLFGSVDDGGSGDASDSVVVGLADSG